MLGELGIRVLGRPGHHAPHAPTTPQQRPNNAHCARIKRAGSKLPRPRRTANQTPPHRSPASLVPQSVTTLQVSWTSTRGSSEVTSEVTSEAKQFIMSCFLGFIRGGLVVWVERWKGLISHGTHWKSNAFRPSRTTMRCCGHSMSHLDQLKSRHPHMNQVEPSSTYLRLIRRRASRPHSKRIGTHNFVSVNLQVPFQRAKVLVA